MEQILKKLVCYNFDNIPFYNTFRYLYNYIVILINLDTYCKPHLRDLCMVLKPVSPRYQHIGILLGVPMDTLGLNPLLNHDDNLSTTLQWWLDNGDNPNNNARSVTWNNIIDVIENGLPNYKVAEEMREFLRKRAKSKKLMPDTSMSF